MFVAGKYSPLLIAEIGGNHEGDIDYAHELLDLALMSKADVIKFQIYNPESLVNRNVDLDRFNHFKKFTLKPKDHISLAKKCIDNNKIYLASVWDVDSIKWINEFSRYYKVGSGDLTAYQIIKGLTKTKKPLILSTGLSKVKEINDTIEFIKSQDSIYKKKDSIALLQCTSNYPIPESESNLSVMNYFKKRYNFTVGYSDHTEGLDSLILAAVLGAEILEFHFTDNKSKKTFRDHSVSLTKDDVELLVEKIVKNKSIIGNPVKSPTFSEIKSKHTFSFRRSLYAKKDINPGEILCFNNIISLRPKKGICASKIMTVIGKKTKKIIPKNYPINENDLIS